MKIFLIEIHIPAEVWNARLITRVSVASDSIQYWKLRELNQFFSGRPWKRFDTNFGVMAQQYLMTDKVRLIVRATSAEAAQQIALSHSSTLSPKPLKKNTVFNQV